MRYFKYHQIIILFLISIATQSIAQNNISIAMDAIDASHLDNKSIFDYQFINSGEAIKQCTVFGEIRFRGSAASIKYTYRCDLPKGNTTVVSLQIHPTLTFSSNDCKQLFEQYQTMPEGSFEYCIYITKNGGSVEVSGNNLANECIYGTNNNTLLINLVSPEDKAKLNEQYPVLNWMVNSSLQSELTYRLRLTDLKDGQNAQNAILRNRALLDEKSIRGFQLLYPTTAPLLDKWQYYVWTVDVFYKNILVGSAETWKFVIIDDSLNKEVPKETNHIEVNIENGNNLALIPGVLKLKYIEHTLRSNLLKLKIYREDKKLVTEIKEEWKVGFEENRKEFDLTKIANLKHGKIYFVEVTDMNGITYWIKLKYFNPEFLN